ncbi:hypothetical protein [Mycoplana dimorpha]|uniref:Uncharacterized protein n=1 Tax=Mycoplana dimorpha TaxID=28320 RepID=A0A2T5BBZ1_MYCDI|nr:hypothetical protein [Mycoplana dimorpha]PTM96490.1 hypothetical protein C7449_103509 [Mycoplana dimorpha]
MTQEFTKLGHVAFVQITVSLWVLNSPRPLAPEADLISYGVDLTSVALRAFDAWMPRQADISFGNVTEDGTVLQQVLRTICEPHTTLGAQDIRIAVPPEHEITGFRRSQFEYAFGQSRPTSLSSDMELLANPCVRAKSPDFKICAHGDRPFNNRICGSGIADLKCLVEINVSGVHLGCFSESPLQLLPAA